MQYHWIWNKEISLQILNLNLKKYENLIILSDKLSLI